MSENQEEKVIGLPENASRELKDGEEYHPIMSPKKVYPEINLRSVSWGIVMAVIFTAAAAYAGLKVGQVMEAAIPIAIIAVGLSTATKRKNALGENVIIQSIGACSGVIVAGAIFTLPAIYILQTKYPGISVNFFQILFSSLLGGILGILFLIPFRKYFVKGMHGKYPFPEATATTQVLVSGEKSSSQVKPLIIAGLIGGLYDFVVATFGAWSETFTSRVVPLCITLADKAKIVFKLNVSAFVLGLGYIVGLRYAAIITIGSALVWFVIVPLLPFFNDTFLHLLNPTYNGGIAAMSPEVIFSGLKPVPNEIIFSGFARHIGIGAIAMAGIIGIIKSWNVIRTAVGLAASEMKGKKGKVETQKVERTQRDLAMKIIIFGIIIALAVTFIFFWLGVVHNLLYAIIGILIVAVIAFLFTTVAATAIATVGTNPVSGMTLMTLIIASVILVAVGLRGPAGMVAALIMGGVVCTALSTAGGFITDLKIGYWLGSTPQKQQTWKFLGVLVSAATVGGVMIILNKVYGFTGPNALVAPQANAMAAVIDSLMSGTGAPWLLYAVGAAIAIILTIFKVPALAFALGMFIPFDLNIPLLFGGAISWYVSTRSKNAALNTARQEKGTLVASGLIAGGALMGVVSAIIIFVQNTLADKQIKMLGEGASKDAITAIKEHFSWVIPNWAESTGGIWLSLLMYGILIAFFIWYVLKRNKK
ncbi:MAG: oligopeptide transporter, OPT family [Paludibacter sp.]|nr:oligopeptide transporter, OPT family [Paludibacter sp.]